jgi:hypothetical protein
MSRRFFFGAVVMLLALSATTGCAVNRTSALLMADADLSKVKTIYVVHAPDDGRQIDQELKTAFEKRGFVAVTGPELKAPYPQDAVVTYVDKWMWDITMYMLELTVTVRDPKNFPLATGNSLHTSLTRKSPSEMADEVVSNIVAAKH